MTLIDQVKRFFSPAAQQNTQADPAPMLNVITRDHHSISRNQISEPALKVLYRLHKAGYQAHLVGGGVRDSLLGLSPKDFDVATDATPEQVNRLFKNSRLIGRRFKLVHVIFGREVIEVATFRAPNTESHSPKQAAQNAQGMILRDNVYGNKDEDAMRRDFTINALYYNIADFSVHAYAGGWEDLQKGIIRLIGDPETRYREDPVRMLRAIRFAGKLKFEISPETDTPIREFGELLAQIPSARLFEESLKLVLGGQALATFHLLREYELFQYLFPATSEFVENNDHALKLVENTMRNTDKRIQAGKSVTPYFFLSALLWPQLKHLQAEYEAEGMPAFPALKQAADRAIGQQIRTTAIPKRFSIAMREVWEMQSRLLKIKSPKAVELLSHPRFRAAYDFLLLRNESGEDLQSLCDFWTQLQEKHPVTARKETQSDKKDGFKHSRPRRSQRRSGNRNRR